MLDNIYHRYPMCNLWFEDRSGSSQGVVDSGSGCSGPDDEGVDSGSHSSHVFGRDK